MALPKSDIDREFSKFGETASGKVAVRIIGDSTSPITVTPEQFTTPTITRVTVSTSSFPVVIANTARIFLSLHNDSNKAVFFKFGATASLTNYTFKLASDETAFFDPPIYTGLLDAISESGGSGSIQVTEK